MTSRTFAAWADVISLVLLILCVLIGGLRSAVPIPIWGLSRARAFSLFLVFTTTIAWTLFRLIYEGITKKPGPREFMLATVVYLIRWLYLWLRVRAVRSKEHKMYQVARALRNVKMLRMGRSSDQVQGRPNRNRGVPEVVIRRGVKDLPAGERYWRGVKVFEEYHEDVGIWEVTLVQKELHKEDLDMLATSRFVEVDYGVTEAAYKYFYKVVMKAVNYRRPTDQEMKNAEQWDPNAGLTSPPEGGYNPPQPANGQPPRVEVDFAPFTSLWFGLPVEGLARDTDATDPRMIGRVARRIAADACAYINDDEGEYEFRTDRQVDVLNECLRAAAGSVFIGGLREGSGS